MRSILVSPLIRRLAVLAILFLISTLLSRFSPSDTSSTTQTEQPNNPSSSSIGIRDNKLTTNYAQSLSKEVDETLALIRKGGPYPYQRDGVVFYNRELKLPKKKAGYYHEYTVRTPGSHDRGARRIVTGSGGEIYYSADHYQSFKRVDSK